MSTQDVRGDGNIWKTGFLRRGPSHRVRCSKARFMPRGWRMETEKGPKAMSPGRGSRGLGPEQEPVQLRGE